MSRSVQVFSVLSLFSRLGSGSGSPACSSAGRRFSSGSRGGWWPRQSRRVAAERPAGAARRAGEEHYDGGEDMETAEEKIQALFEAETKRQKTIKYHMVKRKMTPSGAPQRRLTWDAMEQIRYLKQEQPEEWTVARLAEGFSVSPDVIRRVLRSKFVPAPQRKEKQNTRVMAALGHQALPSGTGLRQDRLKLTGHHTQPRLGSGNNAEAALVPAANQTQLIPGEGSGSPTKSLTLTPPAQFTHNVGKDLTRTESSNVADAINTEEDEEVEESWDRLVFTEEELEELIKTEKPSPAVQVGKDFFDTEGNFLYRV